MYESSPQTLILDKNEVMVKFKKDIIISGISLNRS
jgi:hypothetical protein